VNFVYKLVIIAESKKSGSSFTEFRPSERRKTEKACDQEYVDIYYILITSRLVCNVT